MSQSRATKHLKSWLKTMQWVTSTVQRTSNQLKTGITQVHSRRPGLSPKVTSQRPSTTSTWPLTPSPTSPRPKTWTSWLPTRKRRWLWQPRGDSGHRRSLLMYMSITHEKLRGPTRIIMRSRWLRLYTVSKATRRTWNILWHPFQSQ